jgi:hypothetical protein
VPPPGKTFRFRGTVESEPSTLIPAGIVRVLLTVAKTLESKKVVWAVEGSTSLALQGVSVTPADLDILSDKEGAYRISCLFEEFVTTPVRYRKSPRFMSYFGVLKIRGVKVEIMGNLRVFREGKWSKPMSPATINIKRVQLKGIELPVVSLAEQEAIGYLQERLGKEKEFRKSAGG